VARAEEMRAALTIGFGSRINDHYISLGLSLSLLFKSSSARVAQKIGTNLYASTLPNINRFSKLFHYQNQILSLKIPPHLKCVATLLCEMSAFH